MTTQGDGGSLDAWLARLEEHDVEPARAEQLRQRCLHALADHAARQATPGVVLTSRQLGAAATAALTVLYLVSAFGGALALYR